MDLPPDKAKVLKQYDDEKKWDIICDQVSLFNFHCLIVIGLLRARLAMGKNRFYRQFCFIMHFYV